MGVVLRFTASAIRAPRQQVARGLACQIIIFPGVRMERHDEEIGFDLAHRLRDSTDDGTFDGLSGGRRPRKTS